MCVCARTLTIVQFDWNSHNELQKYTKKKSHVFVQCHWRVIVVIFVCEKPFLWLLIIMITLRTICCCYARYPWTEPDKYCLNCSTDCVEIPAIRRNSEWWDDRTHHQFRSEYGNAYRVQKHESINRCTRVWWNCVASFYHHRILLFFFLSMFQLHALLSVQLRIRLCTNRVRPTVGGVIDIDAGRYWLLEQERERVTKHDDPATGSRNIFVEPMRMIWRKLNNERVSARQNDRVFVGN